MPFCDWSTQMDKDLKVRPEAIHFANFIVLSFSFQHVCKIYIHTCILHMSLGMSNSFMTPWTEACQAPLSVEFPWQEYQSECPFPSPGGLDDPEMKLVSPAFQEDYLPLSHQFSQFSSVQSLSRVLLFETP